MLGSQDSAMKSQSSYYETLARDNAEAGDFVAAAMARPRR